MNYREDLVAIGAPMVEPAPGTTLPAPTRLLDAPPARPIDWSIEGLFLHREITMIAAGGGHFKSTLMLAFAGAIAGGTAALGVYRTGDPAPILFVSEEDSLDIVVNRMEALVAGMRWDRATVMGNFHVLALEGARLSDLRWQLHLRAVSERLGAQVVFLDPLTDLLDGEAEMSPDRARPVIQFLRQLAADGAAVVVAHHLNKPSVKGGVSPVDRVRGAGSWTNAARAVFNVTLDGDTIRLECSKSNRVKRPAPIDVVFQIESAPGNDAEWRSAVFSAAGSWQLPSPNRLSETERQALMAIERCPDRVMSWTAWVDESGLTKQRLSEARKVLLERGLVEKEDSGTRRAGKPVWAYAITGQGVAALVPDVPSPRVRVESVSSPDGNPDSASPASPGRVRFESGRGGESVESASPAPLVRGPALDGPDSGAAESESGPGLEPPDDAYWDGLDAA